ARGGAVAGQRDRRPVRAGLLVAQVEGLAAGVDQRIVVPRREPILVRVLEPGVGAAALADDGAEARVGDDVRPRRRSRLVPVDDDVFARIAGEAAEVVVEEQLGRLAPRLGVLGFTYRRPAARHQGRDAALDRRAARQLFGQRAARADEDRPRDRLHQDAVLARDLARVAHEDAAGAVDHVGVDADRDQSEDRLLQLLAVDVRL